MPETSVLVLAAGKGVRMKSDLPKVLHTVGGRPMIDRVLTTVRALKPRSVCVVTGHRGDEVRARLRQHNPAPAFARQNRLDGSGGAVRAAAGWLRHRRGDVLVTCGDMPLLRPESLRELVRAHRLQKNSATVLTARVANPSGYGRIVRRGDGRVERIVEELDATPRERDISEINTGTYCFRAADLLAALPNLSNKNAKKEYYLTDVLEILKKRGLSIGAVVCGDPLESTGINKRADLALAESALYRRKAASLMAAGVTIIDPSSTYISEEAMIGPETVVWPQTYILGRSRIGSRCRIGPWAHIVDTIIENQVEFKASFSESAVVRSGARIGPFSRLRPGSDVGQEAHVGNFTELKNTRLGRGSKVNHLSYLGDAKLGKNVNIGAGSITCNYDGIRKHPTTIHDHAFIGSNVNLIAPIRVGRGAVVGAGSSISEDVPAGALTLERNQAITKPGWARKKTKK